MGCGASSQHHDTLDGNSPSLRYAAADDESEEGDKSSRTNSIISNSFTTSYASGRDKPRTSTVGGTSSPKTGLEAYRPGSSAADADAQFERWKKSNKGKASNASPFRAEVAESKIVDDFVFGDFKVDPGDVQQQRIERLNRVRRPAPGGVAPGGIRRGASGRDLLGAGLGGSGRRSSYSGTFIMNDFAVKTVDEGDDAIFHYAHEVKVPPGFHPLKRVSVAPMNSHPTRVKVVAISPSEAEFIGGSTEDDSIAMYSMANGNETTCFVGHNGSVVSSVFSRDGKYIATSARDDCVIVWDTMHKDSAKRVVRTFEHPCLAITIEFSCDGKYLVSGCQDKIARVWAIEKNDQVMTFEEHTGVIVCLATHPHDAEVAITGGGDRTLRKWSLVTGECSQKYIGHDGIVISAAFTPTGDKILSNDDRAVKMWNAETGACVLNVTLQSLITFGITSASDSFPPPMPLPTSFLDRAPLTSKQLGYAPNGLLGEIAVNACKIAATKSVFTISCLLPGLMSQSYFAVACTNKMIYIVSCLTGVEETSIPCKAAVFALAAGRTEKLIYGDVFGNVGLVTVVAKPLNPTQQQ